MTRHAFTRRRALRWPLLSLVDCRRKSKQGGAASDLTDLARAGQFAFALLCLPSVYPPIICTSLCRLSNAGWSGVLLAVSLMYCGALQTYKEHIAYFAAYYREHRQELPFIVWRDSSVQHFDTPTGWSCIIRSRSLPGYSIGDTFLTPLQVGLASSS